MSERKYFPSVKDIENAAEILGEIIEPTPLMKNNNLSGKYGADVYLKREDLQIVRSYKIRGAYNKIRSISPDVLKYGIVCASAGNHAQGVAFSCNKLQIMASGAESVEIYHIDKQTGKMINLKGLFKEGVNFIDPISDNIKEQMREQMAADESKMYFLDSETPEWDFQSISEDTTFYVNDSGKLVIVFDEYEVAPGSMGSVEFEIPTEVIQDIVQEGFVS